jgi:hypothetical protein
MEHADNNKYNIIQYTHTYLRTYVRTYIHTYMHTNTHTHKHTQTHTHTHKHTHTHIHTQTHTCTHKHTHKYTHIHTHTHILIVTSPFVSAEEIPSKDIQEGPLKMFESAKDILRVASSGKEYRRSFVKTPHTLLNVKYVLINLLLRLCSHML